MTLASTMTLVRENADQTRAQGCHQNRAGYAGRERLTDGPCVRGLATHRRATADLGELRQLWQMTARERKGERSESDEGSVSDRRSVVRHGGGSAYNSRPDQWKGSSERPRGHSSSRLLKNGVG